MFLEAHRMTQSYRHEEDRRNGGNSKRSPDIRHAGTRRLMQITRLLLIFGHSYDLDEHLRGRPAYSH